MNYGRRRSAGPTIVGSLRDWGKAGDFEVVATGSRHPDGGLVHRAGKNTLYGDRTQTLTVTKLTLLYSGKHYDEKMDFVAPFARFEALAEYGTNKTSVWFESPMTDDKGNSK